MKKARCRSLIMSISICLLIIILHSCSESEPEFLINLVDKYQAAGTYTFPWDQWDGNGNPVSDGTYYVRMSAGSYTSSVSFDISSSASHVEYPCDTSNGEGNMLPVRTSISINSSTYAPGDTVCIEYKLAEDAHVRIDIEVE